MSKKKSTTLSLGEFVGDAYEKTLLPTESKGIERLDSGRPRQERTWDRSDRPDRGERSFERGERSFGGDRDRAPRRDTEAEGNLSRSVRPEGGRQDEACKADEAANWRSSEGTHLRSADSSFSRGGSSFSRARDVSDEAGNWRDAPRKEITPTTSFSRAGDSDRRPADSTPGNWRDALKSQAAPAAPSAAGGMWVPAWKRGQASVTDTPAAATGPAAVAPKVAAAVKETATTKAQVSWDEEEEEKQPAQTAAVDEEKLRGFTDRFGTLLKDVTKKFETFAKKAAENFTAAELLTNIPLKSAVDVVTEFAAEQTDFESIIIAIRRCGVVFQQMQTAMKDNKFELKVLVAFQKAVSKRNFPRVSPDCALIEALWLGLYEAEVVAEDAVRIWTDSPASLDYMREKSEAEGDFGRTNVLFQTQALRQWLLADEEAVVKASAAGGWGSDEEDVDGDLKSFLSESISRSKGGVSIKKSISASAARR